VSSRLLLRHGSPPRTALTVARVALLTAFAMLLAACGASLPRRFVVERDVGAFAFRRYQRVLDVEMPIEGNSAEGHTATYVRRGRGRTVSVVTAFVTVYARAASLGAEIGEALRGLAAYQVGVGRVSGAHVWKLEGNQGDRWIAWVSGRYFVKLGAAPGEEVPDDIAETYLKLYPSDLGEDGRSREGTASAGVSRRVQAERQAEDLPEHLREGSPR
jgi:hypothetical protein